MNSKLYFSDLKNANPIFTLSFNFILSPPTPEGTKKFVKWYKCQYTSIWAPALFYCFHVYRAEMFSIPHTLLSPFLSHTSCALASVLCSQMSYSTIYNELYYFGRLINRGSVSVSVSAPCLSVRSLHEGSQGQWITWLEDVSLWITCMEECRNTTQTKAIWPLWIVNYLIQTSLDVTRTCYRDQRFIKVHHETVLQRLLWVIPSESVSCCP